VLASKTATFTASPNAGYVFSKWTITGVSSTTSTQNPLTITVGENLTLTASFTYVGIVNTPPIAANLSIATPKNTSVNIILSATDVNVNDTLTYFPANPSHGSITQNGSLVTYSPNAGYIGSDSFTYTASDGQDTSNTAIVRITVTEEASSGWARSFGSSDADAVNSLAVESSYIYTAGYFSDTVDFDPSGTSVPATSKGKQDMFLAKYGSDSSLQWLITLGSSDDDIATAISVTTASEVYLVGTFSGTFTFTDTAGTPVSFISKGGTDAIIVKFNGLGVHQWSRQIGGTGNDSATCVTPNIDPSKNIVLGGSFSGTVKFGANSITSNGKTDGFVTKLSNSGEFDWTATFGGTENDEVTALACDTSYNLRIAGNFSSATIDLDPTTGTATKTLKGGQDIFLVKLTTSKVFGWGITLGGTGNDAVNGITLDSNTGRAFIGGYFEGTASLGLPFTSMGQKDAFISAVDSGSGNVSWTRTMGGTGDDEVKGLAWLTTTSHIYAAGSFSGTADFNPDGLGDTINSRGSTDAFLTSFSSAGNYNFTCSVGGTSADIANASAVNQTSKQVYWAGSFTGTADLDPQSGSTEYHTSFGNTDCFLISMTSSGSW
jgi:uncharacterized repeat protein (TIGR02543 family)